jgi:hypothetical protein
VFSSGLKIRIMKELISKQFLFRMYYLQRGDNEFKTIDFRIRNINPNDIIKNVETDLLQKLESENIVIKQHFFRVFKEYIYEVKEQELMIETDVFYHSKINIKK